MQNEIIAISNYMSSYILKRQLAGSVCQFRLFRDDVCNKGVGELLDLCFDQTQKKGILCSLFDSSLCSQRVRFLNNSGQFFFALNIAFFSYLETT